MYTLSLTTCAQSSYHAQLCTFYNGNTLIFGPFQKYLAGISWTFAAATEILVTRLVSQSTVVSQTMTFRFPHKKKSRRDQSSESGGHVTGLATPNSLKHKCSVQVIMFGTRKMSSSPIVLEPHSTLTDTGTMSSNSGSTSSRTMQYFRPSSWGGKKVWPD